MATAQQRDIPVQPLNLQRLSRPFYFAAISIFSLVCGITGPAWCQSHIRASASDLKRFEKSHAAMGVKFTITLFAESESLAEKAFSDSFKRIDELEEILSDYRSESETRKLCRSAPHESFQKVSPELFLLLKHSQQHHRDSDGAFDVSVGRITLLWRQARKKRKIPDRKKVQLALKQTGMQHIRIKEPDQVQIQTKGMRVDFGGIAKGYAADCVIQKLKSLGIHSCLIDASGDIVVSGPPPGKTHWRVKVANRDPDAKNAAPLVLQLKHQAVATSGDQFQFIEIDGKRHSHIIDPKTGYGVPGQRSATVVASCGTDADALASALSVKGAKAGIQWLDSIKHAEGIVIQADNKKHFRRFDSRSMDQLIEKADQNGSVNRKDESSTRNGNQCRVKFHNMGWQTRFTLVSPDEMSGQSKNQIWTRH